MSDGKRLVAAMHKIAQPKESECVDMLTGEVISIDPLKIKLGKIELTESFLVLSSLCKQTTNWRGLIVGDIVSMIRHSKGQRFYVLERKDFTIIGGGGEPGPPGEDGSEWIYGTGWPDNSGGQDNWLYLQDNGNVWKKITGTWIFSGINIKGVQGDPGTAGADGSMWYVGSGNPVTLRNNGDVYLNTTTGNIFKMLSGSWSSVGTSIKGPSGVGIPVAGTTGQVLVKTSDNDYETSWQTIPQWSIAQLRDLIYPIGEVRMTTSDTNPGTYLGGTWVLTSVGRMPVGYDSGQTEFNTIGKTGGAKAHTLTTDEMPSHTHTQNSHNHTQDAHNHSQNAHTHLIDHDYDGAGGTSRYTVHNPGYAAGGVPTSATTATNNAATATNQAATATNQNTGGGQAHNNLPPYEVFYFWKRTA